MGSSGWGFGAAFLGSAVESVEALTIVLAVGVTRGWRAPLQGTVAALAVLGAVVLTLGEVITTRVPEPVLKTTIGALVLLFGLRWLRKAVQRSAGAKALSDENVRYAKTAQEAGVAGRIRGVDWPAFVIAFKGVFLEGLEVAFIVFAVGASSRDLRLASLGGISAMLAVAALGVALRQPLTRVPENTIKSAVGILLASLGTFWLGEGLGARWPLDAVSVLVLVALYTAASRLAILRLRSHTTGSSMPA